MIEDLSGTTSKLVTLALDVATMRHQVIANNIANANTEGFVPQSVSFEEQLNEMLLNAPEQLNDSFVETELQHLKNRLDSGENVHNNAESKVQIDMEMARLAENTIKYQALLNGLNKYSSITKMAITLEGAR